MQQVLYWFSVILSNLQQLWDKHHFHKKENSFKKRCHYLADSVETSLEAPKVSLILEPRISLRISFPIFKMMGVEQMSQFYKKEGEEKRKIAQTGVREGETKRNQATVAHGITKPG